MTADRHIVSSKEQEPAVSADAPDLSAKLTHLAVIAREFSAPDVADESARLATRLTEGRFYVACIGQFKRGKSTLLNALVADAVLPTGIIPVTAIPTVLRYGANKHARVRFRAGEWVDVSIDDLPSYVSEEHNPENSKGIDAVEVFLPSPLLGEGMCLVDTPGLGSIFAGNTAATRAFVPHIDAAIIVVGADPPIAGEELALVQSVAKQVPNLLVVLNKIDRTTDAERQAAIPFTRVVLEKHLGRPIGPIFEISAQHQLDKRAAAWDWRVLVAALQTLAEQSGRTLVRSAGERGLRRIAESLLSVILEEREALLRPIEDSERRVAMMQQTIAASDQSLREIGYLFMAEKHRLSDLFLERRKKFLQDHLSATAAELRNAGEQIHTRYGPAYRRELMQLAQSLASQRVLPWLALEQAEAEQQYRHISARFSEIANDFLRKLAESRVPELARMPHALASEHGFCVPSHFHFEQLIHVAQPSSPLRYVADVALGLAGAGSVIRRDGLDFCEHLLEMNATRVQSDLLQRVDESQSQLEAEIRKLLHEIIRVATLALDHAREAQARGATAVAAKLRALSSAENQIHTLLDA
ncbi:MAG TPA: dynamin family protein [Verrucomicrobiae bacterium]|nr:dynamin family protein [Verrucomicrobiae bacterium]